MARLAREERWLVGLVADAAHPLEQPLLGRGLVAVGKVDIDDLREQALELTWAYPDRDQQVVLACSSAVAVSRFVT
jgi:hypothetical protein